jgi:radical SAM superfamily enzyme YgiQ (UPF0313 family)
MKHIGGDERRRMDLLNKPQVLLVTSKSPIEEVPDSLAIPLGLQLLKHYLNKNDIECDVLDHQIHSEEFFVNKVEQGNYDIIGISVTHWRLVSDLNFLHKLKLATKKAGKRCLYIAGGMQATINYRQLLDCGFDLVCLGFADDNLLDICKRYPHSREKQPFEIFGNLDGIAFLDGQGNVVFNPAKPLSAEAFEQYLFHYAMEMEKPYNEYWAFMRSRASAILHINRRSYVIENARLFTTNRCLANCGFCCCPKFLHTAQNSKAAFIALSASQVHQLILHDIQKYGARAFSFNDEDFLIGNTRGINRAIKICEMIIQSKKKGEMPEDIKFSCQTRASDFFDPKSKDGKSINYRLLSALSQAQFHNVSVGVETFSDRLLKCPSINKGNITSKDQHTVLHALIDYGLYPTINLILGIPEMTVEEMIDTVRDAMMYTEKPCQLSVASHMYAFPGAKIFGLKDYPTTDAIWINPITKERVNIPLHYTPHNEEVASFLGQIDSAAHAELEDFKSEFKLNNSLLIPRIVIALCTFRVIARRFEETELLRKINDKLDLLVHSLNHPNDL